eukprot:TRINITY_DN24162_c0_g1_i2.p1 TRINITY_DN24162_c0_g1~~TRINITY_DN24162_c0_g1_i2.p1  ORF type:complete len:265 (+),score=84.57 TRINITY_DN24162_c0_g1_i2:191-985(+)
MCIRDRYQRRVREFSRERMPVHRSVSLITPTPLRAEVIHGFGRGSKVLGFPTANMQIRWDAGADDLTEEEAAVLSFARDVETGIYAAFACVDDGPDAGVYKVAMSVGWNPTFDDLKTKTVEPWILHDYEEDFYGCHLRLLVVAYIRPEVKFESFDELIQEIRADGRFCSEALDSPEVAQLLTHPFFLPPPRLPVIDAEAIGRAENSQDPAVERLREACLEHGFFILGLSLIHISEPTRLLSISYAVFCLKKKKKKTITNKINSK